MDKQELIDKIIATKKERDRASTKVHNLNLLAYAMQQELGTLEFGKIDESIDFEFIPGQRYYGRITGFQVCDWKEMPICIIETVFRGQKISTHLLDGESIIR
jgi:hypothetical protein